MQERAVPKQALRRRMRWLLMRALIVLGGVVAGTAAAWALSGATASADTLPGPAVPDLGTAVQHASRAAATVHDGPAGNLAGAATEALSRATSADAPDADAPVDQLRQGVARGGERLAGSAAHAVDTTVRTTTSVLRDPKGSAQDVAEGVRHGAKRTFRHLASGWHHVTGRIGPAVTGSPIVSGVVPDPADGDSSNGAGTSPARGTENGTAATQTPDGAHTTAPAPAGTAQAPVTETPAAQAHHIASGDVDVPGSTDRGHRLPHSPAQQPMSPAAVPSGSGTGGQSNSGGGNGVVAAALGDFVAPGFSMGRNAGSGVHTPSGQPGRQPGCTPD